MRKVKGVIGVMVILLFILTGAALAQRGPGGGQPPSPPSASEMVARMKQQLGLTDEQVSRVTVIIQEEISQTESLMKSGNPETGRSKMEAVHQQTETKLAQVLTSEQLTKWKSQRPRGPQGNGGRGSAAEADASGRGAEGPSSSASRSTSGSGIW